MIVVIPVLDPHPRGFLFSARINALLGFERGVTCGNSCLTETFLGPGRHIWWRMQGTLTTLRTTKDYQPYPPMQKPEGVAAAAAAQRQQQDQALPAATQRDTAESLVLLREAVPRLTQQAVRETPTAAPTSRLS